jgi:hypothetical protein
VKWFEFWEKKIRIPTRGWARTASPERSDQRGCPDCRRPTSTLENEIKWSLAATAARDRAARRPRMSGLGQEASEWRGRTTGKCGGSKRRFGMVLEKRRDQISNKRLGRTASPEVVTKDQIYTAVRPT